MDQINNLYFEINKIKNLSSFELQNKKRELIYQDIIYKHFMNINSPYFKYYKNVYYRSIIYEKKKCSKSKNMFKLGITDFCDRYKDKYGVIETKFGIYNNQTKLNHALIQLLTYGIYEHKHYYVLLTEGEFYIIFYNENKKYIKQFHNKFRSKLCDKSPSVLGESNKYDFSKFKIHILKITPSFTLQMYQNFIKNHYE